MPDTTSVAAAEQLPSWLTSLEIPVGVRAERDGISAWDIVVDGRRRLDLRVTLILDPSIGLIVWAHLAPPLGDALRRAYRALLEWNDEFPFAKFALADDGRPVLSVEIPTRWLDEDALGLALARVVGIADRLFDQTRPWVWVGGHVPAGYADRPRRTEKLLGRHEHLLPELFSS